MPRKNGRPPHRQEAVDDARPRVLAVLQTIGFRAGWPTVKEHLQDVPTRIIQMLLKVLKVEHRAEEGRRIAANSKHVDVKYQGVLTVQDSTHTGGWNRVKCWAEVAKDAATTEAWAFGNGKPVTGEAMLGYLEHLKAKGLLPLVWGVDNAPAYRHKMVQAFMEREQVIVLYSRPHTPQDNARAERGIGEGKILAGLGKGVQLQSRAEGVQILDEALQSLNQYWPRRTKGGLTAAQLKVTLPHWQSTTSRSDFYLAARSAIQSITTTDKRTRRKETREAIFRTLEQFGLILRTRGERKVGYVKQDRIS